MPDTGALAKTLSDAVQFQLDGYDVADVLDRLNEDSSQVLGVGGAAICLVDDDQALRFVTATDEKVARLETWMEAHQEGPCQDAYHLGGQTVVEELRGEQRWGGFPGEALACGIRCVASFPMSRRGQRLGAMSFYAEQPRGWTSELLAAGQLLTDLATLYIVNQRELSASQVLARQLQHALDSRVAIEQAKGMIAERKAIDTGGAFGLLRRHARSNNVSLHQVARAVIDGELVL